MLPAWVPAIETKPAPMPLLLLQAFVNTTESDSGTDLLLEPSEAARWLREAGLLAARAEVSPAELQQLRELREAFRALLQSNAGHQGPSGEQISLLRSLTSAATARFEIGDDLLVELQPEGESKISAVVATFLLVIRDAERSGTWERLKACSNPQCRWAYYDRSHSQRGRWCDMAVCGNRAKNRTLRARRR